MRKRSRPVHMLRAAGYAFAMTVLLGSMVWLRESIDPRVEPASTERAAVSGQRSQEAGAPLERAGDGFPIMPSGAHAQHPDEPMHPHPITPAHERIYRENNLVGALSLAVDLSDARRIRGLLAEYRAQYPEDAHRLQEGYEIIAACLERLDDDTRERARRFWSTEIRSSTRRYVRRHCLERDGAS